MKLSILFGGMIVSGTVAAAYMYNNGLQSSQENGKSSARDSISTTFNLEMPGKASPSKIVQGNFESPEAIRESFEKQGENWSTGNLLSFESKNQADCPGQADGSPSRTLYVRYITDYPTNEMGQATLLYTDIKVPSIGGGEFKFQTPNITEKVIRDDYEWKRRYQTRWSSGVDQEWLKEMRAEQDRLSALRMEAQDVSPEQAISISYEIFAIDKAIDENPVRALNENVDDIIEIEAPHTAWSFKYNNHTKKGGAPYRRDAQPDFAAHAAKLSEHAEDIISILDPIRQFGENIENGGVRTILGHECTVKRAGGWDAEACMAEINGESISLWTRIHKAETTAVYIDTSPCVSLAQFLPPPDVQFDEEW